METTNNRRNFLLIIAFFLVPLVFAITWYKGLPEDYRPSNTTNNGELLSPVFKLEPFSYRTVSGSEYANPDIEKVWTLVHFVTGDCDESCSRSLYNTRQMRISFGKDIDRLQRVAIVSGEAGSDSNRKMWASHPDLEVLIAYGGGIGSQIEQQVDGFARGDNAIFLVDPLGNVVMRFPDTLDVKLMKKDIRKLLKLSHIG